MSTCLGWHWILGCSGWSGTQMWQGKSCDLFCRHEATACCVVIVVICVAGRCYLPCRVAACSGPTRAMSWRRLGLFSLLATHCPGTCELLVAPGSWCPEFGSQAPGRCWMLCSRRDPVPLQVVEVGRRLADSRTIHGHHTDCTGRV